MVLLIVREMLSPPIRVRNGRARDCGILFGALVISMIPPPAGNDGAPGRPGAPKKIRRLDFLI
ncbi:hypothetical protein JOD97_002729 [Duganella sp. 1411]|uniref:hypothetical protein n=1 Tax=Duganella sp. 1411 TaxID=2806572 RepID=UPI001AEB0047|nr:hypothetical protein [Duganella sp. 1411]MBP1204687.1 hypothetical protein [Duganella sp. 1411]